MFNKKTLIILSMVLGFFAGLCCYLILGYGKFNLILSVMCGTLFAILLFSYFLIYFNYYLKKYSEFEKSIISPVFYKTNGNFSLANGKIKNGNIYFCEAGIVCVCFEEKPYAVEKILLEDIHQIEYDNIHLNISTIDGRLFVVTLSDVNNVIDAIKEKSWLE